MFLEAIPPANTSSLDMIIDPFIRSCAEDDMLLKVKSTGEKSVFFYTLVVVPPP